MKSRLESVKNECILISPLNWGLGHVTRTIPVIRALLAQNNHICICCNEEQKMIYKNYFPSLEYRDIAGYPFTFNGKGKWALDIIKYLLPLVKFIQKEKNVVSKLVTSVRPTLIISDQRFGFRHKGVRSVIISHQTTLPVAQWNVVAHWLNRRLLAQFDEIWIPDFENHFLSGKLSISNHSNVHFLGPLSRFDGFDPRVTKEKKYKYLIQLSGPEPYIQLFYEEAITFAQRSQVACAFVIPKKMKSTLSPPAHATIYVNPDLEAFEQLLYQSEQLVSRCGYSTLMDLYYTQHKAILVPTPGQHEQLYLAKLHQNKKEWEFRGSLIE